LLWKRHEKFADFVNRLEGVFDQSLLTASFHRLRQTASLRLQTQDSMIDRISSFQNKYLHRLKRTYFNKLSNLLYLRESLRFSDMHFKRRILIKLIQRWISWMFDRKLSTNRKQSSLTRCKLKIYLSRWRLFSDAEMKVKVLSSYLLLKRSFLAMKGLLLHQKLTASPLHGNQLASSDDAAWTMAIRRGRRSSLSLVFKRWKSAVQVVYQKPLLRRCLRKLYEHREHAEINHQYDQFAISYQRHFYFRKFLFLMELRSESMRGKVSRLLYHYHRRGFHLLQEHCQRRVWSMTSLSQGMDHYLQTMTRKYFSMLKSSAKKTTVNDNSIVKLKLQRCLRKWNQYRQRRRNARAAKLQLTNSLLISTKKKVFFVLSKYRAASLLRKMKEYQRNCMINAEDMTDR
jgi:hypothetical protein